MTEEPKADSKERYFFSELDINRSGSPALVQRVEQNPAEMHSHCDFVETVLIVEGSCVHGVSTGDRYELGAGDVLFMPKGTMHSYSDVDSLKLVNILVRGDFLEATLSGLKKMKGFELLIAPEGSFKRTAALSKESLDSCLETVGRLESEAWEGGEGRDEMLRALLTELFVKLFRFAAPPDGFSRRSWPDFGKVANYLEDHINKPASIEAMAKAGGVSKRTLLRRFKSQTGMSPMECLTQMRLLKACRLLRESSLEIKNVASECGFPDSNYFARLHRRCLGVSPRQFRKAHVMPRRPDKSQANA